MKYSVINGQKASKIVLGTDYYGSVISKKEAFMLYDCFKAAGGNNFDTANMYTDGLSEEILGSWAKTQNRDELFIGTKGGQPSGTGEKARLSEAQLRHDIEQSLSRTRLDWFDIYWLHRDDESVPVCEIIQTLNKFIKEGKTKAIGCSNWRADRIAAANEYAASHGLFGFCASQIKWSLAKTSPGFSDDPTLVEMDEGELSYYKGEKLKVFAYAPQGKGFFSKYMSGGEEALSPKAKERYLCEENLRRFEVLAQLAKEKNTGAAAITLAYLLSQPGVDAFPVVGCKNKAQLIDSLDAVKYTLDEKELTRLVP